MIDELAKELIELDREHKELQRKSAELNSKKEELKQRLMDLMLEKEIKSLRINGKGLVTLAVRTDYRVEDAARFRKEFLNHGLEDLLTIHYQTLQAFMKNDSAAVFGEDPDVVKLGLSFAQRPTIQVRRN
jgi:predicted transcriptional regulator